MRACEKEWYKGNNSSKGGSGRGGGDEAQASLPWSSMATCCLAALLRFLRARQFGASAPLAPEREAKGGRERLEPTHFLASWSLTLFLTASWRCMSCLGSCSPLLRPRRKRCRTWWYARVGHSFATLSHEQPTWMTARRSCSSSWRFHCARERGRGREEGGGSGGEEEGSEREGGSERGQPRELKEFERGRRATHLDVRAPRLLLPIRAHRRHPTATARHARLATALRALRAVLPPALVQPAPMVDDAREALVVHLGRRLREHVERAQALPERLARVRVRVRRRRRRGAARARLRGARVRQLVRVGPPARPCCGRRAGEPGRRAREVVRVVVVRLRRSSSCVPARARGRHARAHRQVRRRRVERVRVVRRRRDGQRELELAVAHRRVVVVVVVVVRRGPLGAARARAPRARARAQAHARAWRGRRRGVRQRRREVLLRRRVGELHEPIEAVVPLAVSLGGALRLTERRRARQAVLPSRAAAGAARARAHNVVGAVGDGAAERDARDAVDVRERLSRVEEELGLCVGEGDTARGRAERARGGRGGGGGVVRVREGRVGRRGGRGL